MSCLPFEFRHFPDLQYYEPIYQKMRDYTLLRDIKTSDALWCLEHHPVFTQGQAGKAEHILDAGNIPVVQSDRGGQVTYHGPGQLMVYALFDLKRRQWNIRTFSDFLQQTIILLLARYDIPAHTKPDAPGVYVNNAKICSLGLRVRKGCTYHGLSLNVNMNLSPFAQINPCGFRGLQMTQISEFVSNISIKQVVNDLLELQYETTR